MPKKSMKVVRATGTKLLLEATEELPVPLTEKEIIARATSVARLEEEERKVSAEFETHKSVHKTAVKTIAAERQRLLAAIRERRELRPVKVEGWAHYDEGRFREIRTDTGELLNERALIAAEMQDDLPFETEA